MSFSSVRRVDQLIIGGGPAGTLLAWILAKRGRRVLVVDRDQHPRFAVGESSTPIADGVLGWLGREYELPPLVELSNWGNWQRSHADLPGGKKRGFSYFFHEPIGSRWEEHERRRLLVAANPSDALSDTQWYRPSIDQYFARQSVAAGAELWERSTVRSVRRTGDLWSVEIDRGQGEDAKWTAEVSTPFLVDASGQGGVLRRMLALPDWTSRLWTRTQSTYTHVTDFAPWSSRLQELGLTGAEYPFDADDAAQHHLVRDGWIWVIRFNQGITSVGWTRPVSDTTGVCESDRQYEHGDPCAARTRLSAILGAAEYPVLAPWLDAARIAPLPGRVIHSPRLQRWTGTIVGEGYALLPTAAITLDPLHSTGLAHALTGVQRVAIALLATEAKRDGLLDRYARQIAFETRLLDRLLSTAYACMPSSELFTMASMLYFAVAIRHEELRQGAGGRLDEAVWGADQPTVLETVARGCESLRRASFMGARTANVRLTELKRSLRRGLMQLTKVPLLADDADGLYGYTFATD